MKFFRACNGFAYNCDEIFMINIDDYQKVDGVLYFLEVFFKNGSRVRVSDYATKEKVENLMNEFIEKLNE